MDVRHAGFIVALVATSLLLACSQNVGPFKAQRDVAKVRVDVDKMVADAQANLELVNAQYNSDVINALVSARAHDARNASTPATNNADARRLRAEAKEKLADALYVVDTAKAEASYSVAKAQCEAHAGIATNACTSDATANYDSEMAAARARKEGTHRQVANNG